MPSAPAPLVASGQVRATDPSAADHRALGHGGLGLTVGGGRRDLITVGARGEGAPGAVGRDRAEDLRGRGGAAQEEVGPGVIDPVERGLVGQESVDQPGIVGVGRVHFLTRIGEGGPVVGDRAGALGGGLVCGLVGGTCADAVEGQIEGDPGLLLPGHHIGHIGRAHLHVSRHARGRPRCDPLISGRAGEVGRVGGRRSALELRAPLVVRDEVVVDVLAEVVAIEAQVGVICDPIDEPGRKEQPLQLSRSCS